MLAVALIELKHVVWLSFRYSKLFNKVDIGNYLKQEMRGSEFEKTLQEVPGHSLDVSNPQCEWEYEFLNLSGIVNCVTWLLNH